MRNDRARKGTLMPDHPVVLPRDEHNQKLVDNVHPAGWVNPEPAPKYNLVVIGAGTAGLVSAFGAAGLGARVALVEKHLLGGDCLNTGCVPSKALIRSAHAAADVRSAARFGVTVPEGTRVDFAKVMERMRRLRAAISPHDSAERARELGVDVFLGAGTFVGPDRLEVGGKTLRFHRAVIATGARAAAPPIPGLEETGFLTNESLFSLTELPKRLAVIGAGPIGSEMAQSFRRFGSAVYLVEMQAHILPREDRDAAERVQQSFVEDGIELLLNSKVTRIGADGSDKLVYVESADGETELRVDEILVGLGRAPNVNGMGLEAAGVDHDRTGILVDDRLRTSNRRIYAAGDVASRFKFTHTADAQARIVIQNALFFGRAKTSALTVPWSTYTAPELAHVGLSEKTAAAEGVEIETFTQELDGVDRAILDGETRGFVKVHVRKGTDTIVGATVVAAHAGDMVSEITTAMVGGLGLSTLAKVIHPYPTQAEAIKKVADNYNRTKLTPRVRALFARWFAWWRGGQTTTPALGGTSENPETA